MEKITCTLDTILNRCNMQEPANFMRPTKHANMHLTKFNAENRKKNRQSPCLAIPVVYQVKQCLASVNVRKVASIDNTFWFLQISW